MHPSRSPSPVLSEAFSMRPLGDCAMRVTLGEPDDPATFARAQAFAARLASLARDGIQDCVPAYATVTVFYNPARIGYDAVRRILRRAAVLPHSVAPAAARTVTLPVRYGGDSGPDLPALAQRHGLSITEAIALHSGPLYQVVMVGFLPGFPYLRGLPDALHTPRLETPRTHVPSGSVGIGGAQTGVYPCASPGGWHLIGCTDTALFDLSCSPPSLLQAGDTVRFVPF